MRIIGGKFSGRLINAPSSLPVRPTTDYAKSALFNILNNRIDFEEVKVLDLFAGIGGVSMEFISRGAKHVTSVDINFKCCTFIDVIFADAPFDLSETDTIPDLILQKNMLSENGILIVEHQAKRVLQSHVKVSEVRKYGNCAFSIYSSISQGL